MTKCLFLLSVLGSFVFATPNISCTHEIKDTTGLLGYIKNTPPVLIVFGGESNSGGIADNTSATSGELAVRNLKIFNNTTLSSFDALDIGSNNLTGHVGLNYAASTGHGWELELANRYDDGSFGGRPVYLCKAGQGGTTIAMWADEATYSAESQTIEPYDTFITRVQSAKALIIAQTGQTPIVVLFWAQGINDNATDVATWKTATKNLFNSFRAALGINLPIFTTQFQSITGVSMTSFNTAIGEIVSEMIEVYAINTTGAEVTDVVAGAGNHWGYTGMKQVSGDLIDALITNYLQ